MANIKTGEELNVQYPMKDILDKKRVSAPQQGHLWTVRLPDLSLNQYKEGLKFHPDSFKQIEGLINEDPFVRDDLGARVVNISLPFSTVVSEKETDGNSYWYFAKHNDIGSITFDILEFEDQKTLRWLNAWQSLMINPDGTYNPPAVYKNDITFHRYNAGKKQIMTSVYKNYFVTAINDVQNDYDSNEIMRYNVTLTGDSVEHNIFSLAGLQEDPDMVDKLADILSVENTLDSVDTALAGIISENGFNAPSLGGFF